MKNPLIYLIFLLVGLYLVVNLSQSIISLNAKNSELDKANSRVEEELTENSRLISELSHARSQKYIEKQAREKLGMSKPGETLVVVPQNAVTQISSLTSTFSAEFYSRYDNTPNWQKWLELFW